MLFACRCFLDRHDAHRVDRRLEGHQRQIRTLGTRAGGDDRAAVVLRIIATPLATVLLGGLAFDANSTAALREAARFDPALLQQVSLKEWLLSLVPNNPVRAAADGALLPLVVFSLAYGMALSRVSDGIRETHVRFCQGVADAMTTIIRWVVVAAPIGIFALALSVGARLGAAAAGAIVVYILACVGCLSVAIALLYVITARFGRVPLRVLAPALLPAQTIAFTSRSSLAALPVLLTDAQTRLGLSPAVAGFVLPLCASIFAELADHVAVRRRPGVPAVWRRLRRDEPGHLRDRERHPVADGAGNTERRFLRPGAALSGGRPSAGGAGDPHRGRLHP
jgi:Na+/serine symporter